MLSFFPELLFLSPFAAFLIRLSLAVLFAHSAYRRIPQSDALIKTFGIVDAAIALSLLVGFATQIAALIGFVCTVAWLVRSDWNPYPRPTAALAAVMTFTLIITGPGPFAFDLPL
ncbi:MAG TPA: hypothetical protein VNM40_03970 [Candidatus Paceibacterota bacterium]|nr:hypothetical protein [Candidatus Paceibacterota bacterium]